MGTVSGCKALERWASDVFHLQGVMENNLQLLRETHLMDRDYFKLIFTLVKASSEICHHKSRRTGLYLLLRQCA